MNRNCFHLTCILLVTSEYFLVLAVWFGMALFENNIAKLLDFLGNISGFGFIGNTLLWNISFFIISLIVEKEKKSYNKFKIINN